jgi:membrane associated rhomboid family serine protease
MVFLWAFGPQIEDTMNPRRYAVFYVVGGIVAMLTQVAPARDSTIPCLGASGAIAAVLSRRSALSSASASRSSESRGSLLRTRSTRAGTSCSAIIRLP